MEAGRKSLKMIVSDRIWRTLVADRGPYGDNVPRWYRRACLEVLMNVNRNGDLDTNDLQLQYLPTSIREYMTRIQEVTWNRRFFLAESRTSESLYGLAPPRARYGDQICIFSAAVFRSSSEKSRRSNINLWAGAMFMEQ